jgi:hypothetical protein
MNESYFKMLFKYNLWERYRDVIELTNHQLRNISQLLEQTFSLLLLLLSNCPTFLIRQFLIVCDDINCSKSLF